MCEVPPKPSSGPSLRRRRLTRMYTHSSFFQQRPKPASTPALDAPDLRRRVRCIETLLRELREATEDCRNRVRLGPVVARSEEELRFMRKTVDLKMAVSGLSDRVLDACREKMSDKNISVLLCVQSQILPSLDISVEFFGMYWREANRLISDLKTDLDRFILEVSTSQQIGLKTPSLLLRNLGTLDSDVTSHSTAVLRGRLSLWHSENISKEQQRFSQNSSHGVQRQDNDKGFRHPSSFGRGLLESLRYPIRLGKSKKSTAPGMRYEDLWTTLYSNLHDISATMFIHTIDEVPTISARVQREENYRRGLQSQDPWWNLDRSVSCVNLSSRHDYEDEDTHEVVEISSLAEAPIQGLGETDL